MQLTESLLPNLGLEYLELFIINILIVDIPSHPQQPQPFLI